MSALVSRGPSPCFSTRNALRITPRATAALLANFSQDSYPPSIRQMLKNPEYSLFHHAPALVLILATSSDAQATEDCCLAAENFMLAARDQEIGTCWVGLPPPTRR